jgi:hypothetical protein
LKKKKISFPPFEEKGSESLSASHSLFPAKKERPHSKKDTPLSPFPFPSFSLFFSRVFAAFVFFLSPVLQRATPASFLGCVDLPASPPFLPSFFFFRKKKERCLVSSFLQASVSPLPASRLAPRVRASPTLLIKFADSPLLPPNPEIPFFCVFPHLQGNPL